MKRAHARLKKMAMTVVFCMLGKKKRAPLNSQMMWRKKENCLMPSCSILPFRSIHTFMTKDS